MSKFAACRNKGKPLGIKWTDFAEDEIGTGVFAQNILFPVYEDILNSH